jgi:hypothetical protein
MRWNPYKGPRLGDERVVSKFLWTWKTIGNERRWLERATWLERYLETTEYMVHCGPVPVRRWVAVCWED